MRRGQDTRWLVGICAVVAVLGITAVASVVFRLEKNEVFVLALIPTAGLTLAAVIAAVALVVRAQRPTGPTVERHVIHTKERVLDGRQPSRPQIVTLPAPGNALPSGLYPHLLRGAYLAGQRQSMDEEGMDVVEGEVVDLPGEWDGRFRE